MAKTLVKILKQKFCQKCSECWDLSVKLFEVTHVFGPYKMAKTLEKNIKQNFCQKCSECWDLSVEFFWGYACFWPIQNGQNT